MKAFRSNRAKKILDALISVKVHERDKWCQRCGKNDGRLNVAHIIPRSCLRLRWNENNLILLCYQCHLFWFHLNPIAVVLWLEKKYGRDFVEALFELSKKKEKFDEEKYKAIKSRLMK